MSRCARCNGLGATCQCQGLTRVPCGVEVVVLQHVLECSEGSNTGRFLPLLLERARLRVYAHPQAPARLDDLDDGYTALLFPGTSAAPLPAQVRRLVVLDASWPQARRMVQRNAPLRALPRLALAVQAPAPSLRQAPEGGVSTMQAVARALAGLAESAAAAHLDAAHAALLAARIGQRGYV